MIKLALKDLKLFFADKRAMMLTFAVPIALITLFAFAYGGQVKQKIKQKQPQLLLQMKKILTPKASRRLK